MTASELLLRLVFAAGIILAGAAIYYAGKRLLLARARGRTLGLENLRPGTPGVLYFTTPDCMPCKTFQRPQLEILQRHMGDRLQVIEVDATERPDLANYWGVLSVPTTFIIDSQGQARGMNFGTADAERLYRQICEVESMSPELSFSKEGALQ
ncbi:MAG: thioredoxin family protein [Anaerolineales bacterium]|nr:thioredoxin family protein [Anaerolineales bacterium]